MVRTLKMKNLIIGAITAVSISAAFSFLPAYAYEGAILSEVKINPLDGNSYQIILKTDKNVSVERNITGNDDLVLDMKNTKPAKFNNTVYNNTSSVDHVIVQPVSDNQLRIFLQGTNISSSKISIDTTKTSLNLSDTNAPVPLTESDTNSNITSPEQIVEPAVDNTAQEHANTPVMDTIVVNRPLNSFKPVATYDNGDEEAVEEEGSSLSSLQSAMLSGTSLKNIFNTKNLDWLIRLSVIALVIFGVISLFKSGRKKVKIDLSSGGINKDLDLINTLHNRKGLLNTGLTGTSRNNIASKPGYNSFSNYGIKEYQNSQIPKYNTRSSISPMKTETKFSKMSPKRNDLLTKSPRKPELARPLNQSRIKSNDMLKAQTSIDSMKFLESMAQIYEKSGRTDLSQGLQNNLLKAKINKRAV